MLICFWTIGPSGSGGDVPDHILFYKKEFIKEVYLTVVYIIAHCGEGVYKMYN